MKKRGIEFSVYDPLVKSQDLKKIGITQGSIIKADIFVVGTDHDQLIKDYKKIVNKNTIIIDGKNFFRKRVGKMVFGVGRSLI